MKKKNGSVHTRCLAGALLLSSVMGVAACGDEEEASTQDNKTEQKVAADLPPSSTEKATELAYTYSASNRRDPFKTYFEELQIEQADSEILTELQRYDLDKLKLVAVVVGTATPMAMVEDPTGRGHTVKIGTLIGKRLGQVKHIRRGELVVQEEFRDFTGKRIPQLKQLKLEEGKSTAP